MTKSILFAFCLAVTPMTGTAYAQSGRWVQVSQTNNRDVEVDTETIRRTGSRVTVWQRSRFLEPQRTRSGRLYTMALSQFEYDCEARTSTLLASVARDAQGQTVVNLTVPTYERIADPLAPETSGERIMEFACGVSR